MPGMKGGGGKETCTAPFIRFLLLLLLRLTALYFFYTLHLLLMPTSSEASSCPPDTASSFSTLVSWVSANFTATAASGTPPAAATATTLQHFMSGIAASSRFWDKQAVKRGAEAERMNIRDYIWRGHDPTSVAVMTEWISIMHNTLCPCAQMTLACSQQTSPMSITFLLPLLAMDRASSLALWTKIAVEIGPVFVMSDESAGDMKSGSIPAATAIMPSPLFL